MAATLAVLLVAAAFAVPHLDLGIVTPLINSTPRQIEMFAAVAPIFGWWNAHVGWGTIPAIVIGAGAALWGPAIARRLPWRAVPWVTWATSCAWAFALAMIDGWQRGFAHRLETANEYLRQVPSVTDIPYALRSFSSRILDFQPDSWITHVSGHPPGALLTFVWLDRIGLSGGAWAGLLCLLVGSSAAAAIVVAARALSDEDLARRAAPFVAVAPTAIWVAVSADGYFAGVAAWGLALLAPRRRAGATRLPILAGAGAGLLLGWAIFLNYGLGLIALPAVAVVIAAKDLGSALRAVVPAVLAALAVVGVFAVAGFWWFDGYLLVQQRYWQGIAANRPFQYWVWAKLRVGGVRRRTGHGGGGVASVRRGGRQTPLRPAPGDPRRAPGHDLRGPQHAQQGGGRADLVALHHVVDRRRGAASAASPAVVARCQRARRAGVEQCDPDELVARGLGDRASNAIGGCVSTYGRARSRLGARGYGRVGSGEADEHPLADRHHGETARPTSSASCLAQSMPTDAHRNHGPSVFDDSSRTHRDWTPLISGSNSTTHRPPRRINSPARRRTRVGSPPRPRCRRPATRSPSDPYRAAVRHVAP